MPPLYESVQYESVLETHLYPGAPTEEPSPASSSSRILRIAGLKRRTILGAGYGAIIALLLFSAIDAYQIQNSVVRRTSEIHREYVNKEELVVRLRRTVWLGANDCRDFFLNPDPGRDKLFRTQIRDLTKEGSSVLNELAKTEPDSRTTAALHARIQDFWNTLEPIADGSVKLVSPGTYTFVQREIVPRRNALSGALRELAEANREALENSEQEFATNRRAAGRRLLIVLGLCVLFGVLVARFSLRYAGNLEQEALRRYEEVAAAKEELEHLSARLLQIQEDERKRLSRELHDEIGQTLTALRIEISHANAIAGPGVPAIRERLDRARTLAERTLQSVRDTSLLLRPSLLDDLGLAPALQWQLEDFSRRSGIASEFSATGVDEEALPEALKTSIYRLVQEALHNCEKHSRASQVKLSIEQTREQIAVAVEDNGCGFQVNAKGMPGRTAGLGVIGMRERAAMIGGAVTLRSAPGNGAAVVFRCPIPAAPAVAAAMSV